MFTGIEAVLNNSSVRKCVTKQREDIDKVVNLNVDSSEITLKVKLAILNTLYRSF
jgi:hypothetical protein